MKKKLIASILTTLLIVGTLPVGASAAWKQNSDNSWSWTEDGYNSYGWKQIDGNWYYFKDAKMQTGWLNNGYYYYLGNDGSMKTGWVNDGGTWYYLKSDGVLATDTVVDGYYVNAKGVMQPKENQKVLLDNKYVKITYLLVNDTGYSKGIKVKVDNKSTQDLIVQTDKISVNGYMVYGMFSPNVTSGKSAISEIEFNNKDITNGFSNIEGNFLTISKDYKRLSEDNFSVKF
jgi:hypothetical protein